MRTTGSLLLLAGSLALAGCPSSPTPPPAPTWAEDVQPIILGSCAHCHGGTANTTGGGYRFDICDLGAFAPVVGIDLDPGKTMKIGATTPLNLGLIKGDIKVNEGLRPKMPPPPAHPLSDYERGVLENWLANKPSCGTREGNQKPTAKLVGRRTYKDRNLTVTFDLTDPDGDTVLGKIAVGASEPKVLERGGRHKVTLNDVDDEAPVVTATDGWDMVDITLK